MKKIILIMLTCIVLVNFTNAQKRIDQLPVATTVASGNLFVIMQTGVTKQLAASKLLDVINDSADILRDYTNDKITNMSISSSQITNGGVAMVDIAEYAVSNVFMSSGPKVKTTTSGGDTLIAKVDKDFLPQGTLINIKVVFKGGGSSGGVGKVKLLDSGGGSIFNVSTATLDQYTCGYIDVDIRLESSAKCMVRYKVYSYNSYSSTYSVTQDDYTRYNMGSYYNWGDLSIYYNSTIIGFSCQSWIGEVKFLDSKYSGYFTNY
jgi:hypothetical protein